MIQPQFGHKPTARELAQLKKTITQVLSEEDAEKLNPNRIAVIVIDENYSDKSEAEIRKDLIRMNLSLDSKKETGDIFLLTKFKENASTLNLKDFQQKYEEDVANLSEKMPSLSPAFIRENFKTFLLNPRAGLFWVRDTSENLGSQVFQKAFLQHIEEML